MYREVGVKNCNGCVHHWILVSPSGKDTIAATCRMCGRNRTFPAAVKHDFSDIRMSVTYYEKLSMGGAWL